MEVVLGVSMTPTAVRMALVEGDRADGVTVDHDTVAVPVGTDAATLARQVLAAIVGTRDGAAEGAHRLAATGVAWTDHTAAAQLRDALRAQRIDDVVLVSELHAAGALAQAVGDRAGCEHTALVFLEGPLVTLAVVRTADGAVVSVSSRSLRGTDGPTQVAEMVAHLEAAAAPPEAVFVIGAGTDVAIYESAIARRTELLVHAPQDAETALARGAALAAARTPRFEATTVGLYPAGDSLTAAESTTLAAGGYTVPSAYSAVPDVDSGEVEVIARPAAPRAVRDEADEPEPFLLVGSALASIFVVGMVALVISLAVTIRPTVDQRPDPGQSATGEGRAAGSPPPAVQTIEAPVPVVQQAPRAVVVTPAAPAVAPVQVAQQAAPAAPVPVAPPPAAELPAAIPAAPPASVVPAPIVQFPMFPPIVIAPMLPSLLPPAPVAPGPTPPRPVAPAPSTTTSQAATPSPAVTTTSQSASVPTPSAPAPAAPSVSTSAPSVSASAPPPSASAPVSSPAPTESSAVAATTAPLLPLPASSR